MGADLKDPKILIFAAVALAGAGGLGHTLGLTVEPTSVTDLRIEKAKLEVRVEVLTGIAEECSAVLSLARIRAVTAVED